MKPRVRHWLYLGGVLHGFARLSHDEKLCSRGWVSLCGRARLATLRDAEGLDDGHRCRACLDEAQQRASAWRADASGIPRRHASPYTTELATPDPEEDDPYA